MQRASQILGKISAAPRRSKGADPLLDPEQLACAAWARAAGKKIAQHTRPAKLVRGRLVVEVEDAVWQGNLFSLSRHILSNLERALGPGMVSDLEFRIMPRRREPQRAESLASSGNDVDRIVDDADDIGDPGMRRVYRAARQKELA
jgi:predicted nucleic acid-binding Zn ribbon protein